MNVLIVTFNLSELSDEDYRAGCESEAPAFAGIPGLIAKVWLADPGTNTYGGVYTFVDRESMEAYTRSDLFKSIGATPNFVNLAAVTFDVIEGATRVTHGLQSVAA
jgi:hypothetical protein